MTTMSKYDDQSGMTGQDQRLQVVLVYEDLSTGLRAKQILAALISQFPFEIDFDLELLRIQLLKDLTLFEQAVHRAAKADIVFFSAHGSSELPATLTLWFQRWLAAKGKRTSALAVSLDPAGVNSATRARTLEFLQALARLAGVEVFLHQVQAQPTEAASRPGEAQNQTSTKTAARDNSLYQPENQMYRDWGINE